MTIEAYCDKFSAFPNDIIKFGISAAPAGPVTATFYDVTNPGTPLVVSPNTPFTGAVTKAVPPDGRELGFGWVTSGGDTWVLKIPATWPSGIYEVRFNRTATDSTVVRFVVLAASNWSKILFCWPMTTNHAYNGAGGGNLYDSPTPTRRRRVSFDRPLPLEPDVDQDLFQWMHANGFHADACSSLDLHTNPNGLLSRYRLLVLAGHDEYWSKEMRDNVEAFVFAGGNLAVFSGNTCWWQVRFEANNRQMVCYKTAVEDPLTGVDDSRVTINWASAPVNRPENRLLGMSYRNGSGNWVPAGAPDMANATLQVVRRDPADEWVFGGTSLIVGSTFAQGALGYETDAVVVNATNQPTGDDGTPTTFRVLARANLSSWRAYGQGGGATMGYFTNVGTVFMAASVGWGTRVRHAPVNDPIVRITGNVLGTLQTLNPKAAATFPTRQVPTANWTAIATPRLMTGLTASVEGHLFGAESGTGLLHRRAPVGEPEAWTNMPVNQQLTAMTCSLIQPGRLFAVATAAAPNGVAANDLIWRPPTVSTDKWTTAKAGGGKPDGVNTIVALAYPLRQLFGVTWPDQKLRVMDMATTDGADNAPQTKTWRLVGDAPDIKHLCYMDGKLFAGTAGGKLLCRESVDVDLTWSEIGTLPAGTTTVALTCYYGRLFALDSNGQLRWRSATPQTPMRTGNMLFYNAATGVGAIGPFAGNGGMITRTMPQFSSQWSVIAAADNGVIIFYNVQNRSGATGLIQNDSTFQSLQNFGAGSFGTNWTHVVPVSSSTVLFYSQSEAKAQTALVNANGTFTQTNDGFYAPGTMSTWDRVVADRNGILFFYSSTNGSAATARINPNMTLTTLRSWGAGSFSLGWSHIVRMGKDLLFYNQTTNRAETGRLNPFTGAFSGLPWSGTLSPWTHIIAASNRLLLFYNSSTRNAAAGGWAESGEFRTLQSYDTNAFAAGWTHMVST